MECIHLNFLTDNKGKKFLSPSLPNSDLNGKILKVIISDGSTKRVYPVFQQKAGVMVRPVNISFAMGVPAVR